MANTTVNLGMLPQNRGEYSSSATYYKDNIVQYNGSSYICTAAMDLEHPSGITGVAPYDSDPATPNTGWAVFSNDSSGVGEGVYNVSVDHTTDNKPKVYASLSAALNDIPAAKQKGGMSIKFIQGTVQTSDHKYVQFRLMANQWSTTESDWQGVDKTVTIGSRNLVESGAIYESEDVLKTNIGDIASVVGGIPFEKKTDVSTGVTWIDGKVVFAAGTYEGVTSDSATASIITINITNYAGKKLLYSNGISPEVTDIGMAFYSGTPNQSTVISGAGKTYLQSSLQELVLSIIDIPQNAKYVRISCPTLLKEDFKAFAIETLVTDGISKELSGLVDDVYQVIERTSLNLFNPLDPDIINPGRFTSYNTIAYNGDYFITGYIPVEARCTYWFSASDKNTTARFVVFYDFNKVAMSDGYIDTSVSYAAAPSNAKYMRVCAAISSLSYLQISKEKQIPYTAYSLFASLKNKTVTKEKLDSELEQIISDAQENNESVSNVIGSKIVVSENLLNPNDQNVSPGHYISNSSGNIAVNSTYTVTGYIPVVPGKEYYFGTVDSIAYARTVLFYNESKQPITSSFINSAVTNATAPENSCYMRCSLNASGFDTSQISADSLKPYQPYIEPYLQYFIKEATGLTIPNNSVDKDQLSEQVSKLVYSKLNHFTDNDTLLSGEYITLPNIHIQKNNVLTCNIEGAITSVSFGVGYSSNSSLDYRDYAALWVTVDSSFVTQYRYYNEGYQQVSKTEHNMTLTSVMKLELACKVSDSYFKLSDNLGNVFEMPVQNGGCGQPFVYNGSSGSLICKLSDYPMDLHKPIWVFGDSYISFNDPARWPYYFNEKGYVNWLSNNQPGMSPETAWLNLQNLISLGFIPKMIVWLLGMNGNTSESMVDGHYVINTYQKTYIDYVKSLCERMSIELVFGVIPTVPTRQKTGFGDYVKSLGVRYIDFAYAVGANEQGVWNTGLLSSDGIHPTEAGAKVLASQVMVDCPELTMVD